MSSNPSEDDNVITLLLLACGVGGFGLFSVTTLFAPAQAWMIQHGVLVEGSKVLLGWGEGNVGLDLARIIVVAGLVLLLLGVTIAVLRKRWSRRDV